MTDPVDNQELGKLLLNLTLKDLVAKIKSGNATAADLNVARSICRDLNIQALPTPGSPLQSLAASLPFAGSQAITH